ncbi:rhodanese-like domain-containing protein [Jejudonia soesokkakensis]|uniref:Rhodanese-like domain-containing protein n=1 Tax=Jejudonia soesokkakensis TaxID=1323432 RepID=A0ABW2MW16_9FLAO
MKKISFILFTVLLSVSATAQKSLDELLQLYNTRSVPYISVEELRMLQLNEEVVILDARESSEFETSHIATSQCVGFNQFSAEAFSEKIKDKNTPIVVYCSLGIRSEQVGEKLKKAGYTNVQNLYGGIFEWKNKDYPILDLSEKETDSVHTFNRVWSKWLNKGIKKY